MHCIGYWLEVFGLFWEREIGPAYKAGPPIKLACKQACGYARMGELDMKNETPQRRKWTAKEVKQWYQDTGTFTYVNPNDLNLVVKKPQSEGWTVNWANPKAYLLLGAILALIFIILRFAGKTLA